MAISPKDALGVAVALGASVDVEIRVIGGAQ